MNLPVLPSAETCYQAISIEEYPKPPQFLTEIDLTTAELTSAHRRELDSIFGQSDDDSFGEPAINPSPVDDSAEPTVQAHYSTSDNGLRKRINIVPDTSTDDDDEGPTPSKKSDTSGASSPFSDQALPPTKIPTKVSNIFGRHLFKRCFSQSQVVLAPDSDS